MALILFDPTKRESLFPLTTTKAFASLRFGILSISERWQWKTKQEIFVHTAPYLQPLYGVPADGTHYWVNAAVMPDDALIERILELPLEHCLCDENGMIAAKTNLPFGDFQPNAAQFQQCHHYQIVKRLQHPWEIMLWNDAMIREDFKLVTKGRASQPISPTVNTLQQADIFIEEGAKLEFCTLNSKTGPIYIGKDAEIMEGSSIRGPFSLGTNALVKMNSRIYGATTLGPGVLGGGEIKNSVIMGFTNKAHDGYLGDAVIGEWCNFGAGTTNSNVKNTAGDVKVWDYGTNTYQSVGQKCGLIMGDYSRISINSSINTGSVIGVSCNVFGAGLLPTIIEDFSWGASGNRYDFQKALFAIDNWKKMKWSSLTEAETSVLKVIFDKIQH
jgi:UDP-N-acetylglucosamine diphosphorylase/glucosamine-1-phosphate N-acetyltransferase